MADSRITQLPSQLAALPAANDVKVIVDTSDTTDSAQGTTKWIRYDDEHLFAVPTSEPSSESDLSVLPGGVTPAFGFRIAPRAAGGFWMILAGQTTWRAYVPIN